MKRKMGMISGAIATIVLAAGLSLAGATAAQATPGSCATGIASDGHGYGNCSTGTGQYRIGIPCTNVFTSFDAYSDWKNVGVPASVSCPWPSTLWTSIPGGPHVLVEKRG